MSMIISSKNNSRINTHRLNGLGSLAEKTSIKKPLTLTIHTKTSNNNEQLEYFFSSLFTAKEPPKYAECEQHSNNNENWEPDSQLVEPSICGER